MNEAAVLTTANPNGLSEPDYYTTRLTEAQLAYERKIAAAEAVAEATVKAEQKMIERNVSKLLRKFSPEEVADLLEVPLDQVNRIAAKQNNELTFVHKKAPMSNLAYLEMLSNSPYFVSRRNEAQLAELRYKAKKQTADRIIYVLLRKFSPEEVADLLGAPLDRVHKIAKRNYSFVDIKNIYEAAVLGTANPDGISKADYYVKPLTKAQLAYERKETERKTVEGTISILLKKLSPEVVADVLEMPLNQVLNIAQGSYHRIDFKKLWEIN